MKLCIWIFFNVFAAHKLVVVVIVLVTSTSLIFLLVILIVLVVLFVHVLVILVIFCVYKSCNMTHNNIINLYTQIQN